MKIFWIICIYIIIITFINYIFLVCFVNYTIFYFIDVNYFILSIFCDPKSVLIQTVIKIWRYFIFSPCWICHFRFFITWCHLHIQRPSTILKHKLDPLLKKNYHFDIQLLSKLLKIIKLISLLKKKIGCERAKLLSNVAQLIQSMTQSVSFSHKMGKSPKCITHVNRTYDDDDWRERCTLNYLLWVRQRPAPSRSRYLLFRHTLYVRPLITIA